MLILVVKLISSRPIRRRVCDNVDASIAVEKKRAQGQAAPAKSVFGSGEFHILPEQTRTIVVQLSWIHIAFNSVYISTACSDMQAPKRTVKSSLSYWFTCPVPRVRKAWHWPGGWQFWKADAGYGLRPVKVVGAIPALSPGRQLR